MCFLVMKRQLIQKLSIKNNVFISILKRIFLDLKTPPLPDFNANLLNLFRVWTLIVSELWWVDTYQNFSFIRPIKLL